ncbi:hypothetical protein GCM10010294_05820 [Streptomyces griseoloalbus]|nr:hypothetical protein GCM10010294_05820 [Streptomyces griseoloalbus]
MPDGHHPDVRVDMQHRTVAELMTRDVVKARRDLPFKEIVRLLAENDVTAVPVVDDLGRPMGVVSEADLLRKSSDRADPSGRVPVPHLEAWERANRAPVAPRATTEPRRRTWCWTPAPRSSPVRGPRTVIRRTRTCRRSATNWRPGGPCRTSPSGC